MKSQIFLVRPYDNLKNIYISRSSVIEIPVLFVLLIIPFLPNLFILPNIRQIWFYFKKTAPSNVKWSLPKHGEIS